MGYGREIEAKQSALATYFRQSAYQSTLQPLVISPLGRNYRTVTKRKVSHTSHGASLTLQSPDDAGRIKPLEVGACAIEPGEHAAIYDIVGRAIRQPRYEDLASMLHYVVIKGNYRELTVVLNIECIDGAIVKSANALSRTLTHVVPSVVGFFLYEGEEGGYYMGARSREQAPKLRRVFGKEKIYQNVLGRHFFFPPASFSQVNLSMADTLVQKAGEHLALHPGSALFDLYCGYGLFALCLADQARTVLGIEISHAAIDAATENASRNHVKEASFHQSDITADTVNRFLHRGRPDDVVLLDPPRNGTAEGVIETVAARRFRRIVHLFCNIEIVETELRRWKNSGYEVQGIIPFDLFPGTASVELMAVLAPGQSD